MQMRIIKVASSEGRGLFCFLSPLFITHSPPLSPFVSPQLSSLFWLPPFKKMTFVFVSSAALPPSLSPSLSLCVVLISDRHCSCSQWATETAAQKNMCKNTLVNTTPQTFPFFISFLMSYHLISLTSHLPLTEEENPLRLSHRASLLILLSTFWWQLQKPELTRRENEGLHNCIDMLIWNKSAWHQA